MTASSNRIYGVGLALDYARMAFEDDPRPARQKIEQSIEALNRSSRISAPTSWICGRASSTVRT